MSNPMHFNDEYDWTNDDGHPTLDEYVHIPQEWLDEEDEYWSEATLDPGDEDNYDPVDDSENSEAADEWGDEDCDETPIGLDYDGYNDPDNY